MQRQNSKNLLIKFYLMMPMQAKRIVAALGGHEVFLDKQEGSDGRVFSCRHTLTEAIETLSYLTLKDRRQAAVVEIEQWVKILDRQLNIHGEIRKTMAEIRGGGLLRVIFGLDSRILLDQFFENLKKALTDSSDTFSLITQSPESSTPANAVIDCGWVHGHPNLKTEMNKIIAHIDEARKEARDIRLATEKKLKEEEEKKVKEKELASSPPSAQPAPPPQPPEEFLDAYLKSIMTDPVILPSGLIVDRETAATLFKLDHNKKPTTQLQDPFNKVPFKLEDLREALELQARIAEWMEVNRIPTSTVSAEPPEELCDTLVGGLLIDPVILPSSKKVVDRETAYRSVKLDYGGSATTQLLDPFNRATYDGSQLVDAVEIRKKIEEWKINNPTYGSSEK